MDKKGSHSREESGVYRLFTPAAGIEIPLMLDSPHSGRDYPDDFAHACPRDALERAEDNYVDVLLDGVVGHGATLLCALFPRTYIDVNRAEDDIDIDLLAERWPGPIAPTARSHAGIGLIRRVVRPGLPVYDHPLNVAEIQTRLNRYYHPYHTVLHERIDDLHYRYGQVWHLNMHSMPSLPLTPLSVPQPDFVIGDRDGTSCNLDFRHFMRETLKAMGYRVAINHPYKGVEIIRRTARPDTGRHAIQLEINKALYWDERHNRPRPSEFETLRANLTRLSAACGDYIGLQLIDWAAD